MCDATSIKLKPDCELERALGVLEAYTSWPNSTTRHAWLEARAHLLEVIWKGHVEAARRGEGGHSDMRHQGIANEIMGCEQ